MSDANHDAEADNFIGGKADALLVAAVIVTLSGLYLAGGALMDFSARQQINSVVRLLFYIAVFAMLALADRKSTRLNSSHIQKSRMPSSA